MPYDPKNTKYVNKVTCDSLNVLGNGYVQNNLDIGEDVTVGQNLDVSGNSTVDNNLLVGNDATITRDLIVNRNATVAGTLTATHLVTYPILTKTLTPAEIRFPSALNAGTRIVDPIGTYKIPIVKYLAVHYRGGTVPYVLPDPSTKLWFGLSKSDSTLKLDVDCWIGSGIPLQDFFNYTDPAQPWLCIMSDPTSMDSDMDPETETPFSITDLMFPGGPALVMYTDNAASITGGDSPVTLSIWYDILDLSAT